MNIAASTEDALQDAFEEEVRRLFAAYLHALTVAADNENKIQVAGERYQKGLQLARESFELCLALSRPVSEAGGPSVVRADSGT